MEGGRKEYNMDGWMDKGWRERWKEGEREGWRVIRMDGWRKGG